MNMMLPKVTQVNNICCLGYEDIFGHKYEMMDNVDSAEYEWQCRANGVFGRQMAVRVMIKGLDE